MNKEKERFFDNFARKIRVHVINMTHKGKSSHVGSALSIVDILTILYCEILNYDPNNPDLPLRDRFILSKGHAGSAVYATLSEAGFFPESWLRDHYQNGSKMSGHISHIGIPGVEFSTGSLGHGLGIGSGMALAAKLKSSSHKIFVLMSDGECDEGSVWESVLFSAHRKLNNLVAIIDYNKLQSIDTTEKTLSLEPFKAKWISFGWKVIEAKGHNYSDLMNAFNKSNASEKPVVIICHTIKGYGISFMENNNLWHYRSPQGKEYEDALKELNS